VSRAGLKKLIVDDADYQAGTTALLEIVIAGESSSVTQITKESEISAALQSFTMTYRGEALLTSHIERLLAAADIKSARPQANSERAAPQADLQESFVFDIDPISIRHHGEVNRVGVRLSYSYTEGLRTYPDFRLLAKATTNVLRLETQLNPNYSWERINQMIVGFLLWRFSQLAVVTSSLSISPTGHHPNRRSVVTTAKREPSAA